jgi:hypothetical protein
MISASLETLASIKKNNQQKMGHSESASTWCGLDVAEPLHYNQ